MGGDEFAIILTEKNFQAAEAVINKNRIRLLNSMKEKMCTVTFSIGAVTLQSHSGSYKEVIKMADDLMYAMKKAGKNNFKHVNKGN